MLFDIPGYNGIYKIDKEANIFSKNGNFKMKPFKSSGGYLRVSLCKNGKTKSLYIHRIMGSTFLGLDLNDKTILVCHKDDNKENNILENLFLGTHKDNMQDMIKKGRQSIGILHQRKNRGEFSKKAKITNDQAKKVKSMILQGKRLKFIAETLNVSIFIVKKISSGKSWKWLQNYEN